MRLCQARHSTAVNSSIQKCVLWCSADAGTMTHSTHTLKFLEPPPPPPHWLDAHSVSTHNQVNAFHIILL